MGKDRRMKPSIFQPTEELLRRNPLIKTSGVKLIKRMREHPDAPRWNHEAGDRIDGEGLKALKAFERGLRTRRVRPKPGSPSGEMIEWVKALRPGVLSFNQRIPPGLDLEADWGEIATMSREDVRIGVEKLVPLDADLGQLIVYKTAGTTGHPLLVPHHPRAAACYQPMLAFALGKYGIRPRFGPGMVACMLICAQAQTVAYPTVLSFWNGAGFAKININPSEWPTPESPHRYFKEFSPFFLTGDPISFSEMMKMKIPVKPAALVTTAVALSAGLKKRLEKTYKCPVIDWYSLTETGPIGYACPKGHGYHVLPHDLYVEAVDENGRPVKKGERGEMTVTGGRNPFLPLLRYRTGDWGRLDFGRCSCGDPMPRILDLEGRAPVLFRAPGGPIINPVDVSRVLREFPLVQHEFRQDTDLSCDLEVRPVAGPDSIDKEKVIRALRNLFGPELKVKVRVNPRLGNRRRGGKTIPYQSDLLLEE
jgi:phenylacetate-CoA ligase